MARTQLIIRQATVSDASAMARVDALSWPTDLATTTSEWVARILAYPAGQLVAEANGRIVGTSSAQRITGGLLAAGSVSYDLVTDSNRFARTHDDHGEIYQLVGVGVLPEHRGDNLGRSLVDRQIEFARSLPEIRRIVGFTRPAGFVDWSGKSIDEYVQASNENGHPLDTVLAFHLDAGAKLVSVLANFRPNDAQSNGYGVLIEYPRSSA